MNPASNVPPRGIADTTKHVSAPPAMETDPAGAVQWDVTHYPWGRVFQEQGIRQSEVVMGLDWQVNDPAIPSATREFNFRDYRWMTPDPDNAGSDLSDSQSWDMYSYVGDNPTSRNDPSGESYYLLGGSACGVQDSCDKEGYLLDANGQREIVTDQQVLGGAVGSTVGANGVSTITTSQGTFEAQFFDNSPATYEVSGQPGSVVAAIGLNALFGLSNAASDFFAPIVSSRPSYMQDVPTGTGVAANIGATAALLGTALIGPGGEEVALTEHGLEKALERGITRQEINEAVSTAKASGQVVGQLGKYGTVQQVFTGKNNVVVVIETTGRNAGKAISTWRK